MYKVQYYHTTTPSQTSSCLHLHATCTCHASSQQHRTASQLCSRPTSTIPHATVILRHLYLYYWQSSRYIFTNTSDIAATPLLHVVKMRKEQSNHHTEGQNLGRINYSLDDCHHLLLFSTPLSLPFHPLDPLYYSLHPFHYLHSTVALYGLTCHLCRGKYKTHLNLLK